MTDSRKTRIQRSDAEKAAIIARIQAAVKSGSATISAIKKEGIAPNLYYAWSRPVRKPAAAAAKARKKLKTVHIKKKPKFERLEIPLAPVPTTSPFCLVMDLPTALRLLQERGLS